MFLSLSDNSNADRLSEVLCFNTSAMCNGEVERGQSWTSSCMLSGGTCKIEDVASWSVHFVQRLLLRYERRRSTDHSIASRKRCVVSYCCSVSMRDRNQLPICFVASPGCTGTRTQPN